MPHPAQPAAQPLTFDVEASLGPVRAAPAVSARARPQEREKSDKGLDGCCGAVGLCNTGNCCGEGRLSLCCSAVFCSPCVVAQMFALTYNSNGKKPSQDKANPVSSIVCIVVGVVLSVLSITYYALYAADAMGAASAISAVLFLASAILIYVTRVRSRRIHGDEQNCCCDCMAAFFCPCCSLLQLGAFHRPEFVHPFEPLSDPAGPGR